MKTKFAERLVAGVGPVPIYSNLEELITDFRNRALIHDGWRIHALIETPEGGEFEIRGDFLPRLDTGMLDGSIGFRPSGISRLDDLSKRTRSPVTVYVSPQSRNVLLYVATPFIE